MKKADEGTVRVNALARALGYVYKDGEYTTGRAPRQQRAHAQAIETPGPVRRTRTPRRRRSNTMWPGEVYENIRVLHVGATLDITEHVRASRIDLKRTRGRISQFAFLERAHRPGVRYKVHRESGHFVITRIA